jgi:5'-nucleotidase
MRVVLTNDDGIDAPGILALARAVARLDVGEVFVVAPNGPRSGCGHVVTTHAPIDTVRRLDGSFSIAGMPADCVRLALHHLVPGVDWVLSGINAGGNLGADVYHSGTAAAAREAAFHGVPSIAISHYIAKGLSIDWDVASELAAEVLRDLMGRPRPAGFFWNVNLPHPLKEGLDRPWFHCPLDPSPLPLAYRVEGDRAEYCGNYHDRVRRPGGDVDVCFSGRIAVSRIPLGGGSSLAEGGFDPA